jgi:hypothetical protein
MINGKVKMWLISKLLMLMNGNILLNSLTNSLIISKTIALKIQVKPIRIWIHTTINSLIIPLIPIIQIIIMIIIIQIIMILVSIIIIIRRKKTFWVRK